VLLVLLVVLVVLLLVLLVLLCWQVRRVRFALSGRSQSGGT
jgi:hypothetical protein